jgi:hypothetical protein
MRPECPADSLNLARILVLPSPVPTDKLPPPAAPKGQTVSSPAGRDETHGNKSKKHVSPLLARAPQQLDGFARQGMEERLAP